MTFTSFFLFCLLCFLGYVSYKLFIKLNLLNHQLHGLSQRLADSPLVDPLATDVLLNKVNALIKQHYRDAALTNTSVSIDNLTLGEAELINALKSGVNDMSGQG